MHHFVAIYNFKLWSGNAKIETKLFWSPWPWHLKPNLDLLHGHHFCQRQLLLKITWSYHEGNIVKKVRRTDGHPASRRYRSYSRLIAAEKENFVVTQKKYDDVIKLKHFPRYWPFVWGIHRSPVNSPKKSQWRGALMFSLICAWISGWVNNREAGDLRRYRGHYNVIVMG